MDEVNERLARVLDGNGDHGTMRRLPPPRSTTTTDAGPVSAGLATAIVLVTEMTGFGPDDEPTELGKVRVAYDPAKARGHGCSSSGSGLSRIRHRNVAEDEADAEVGCTIATCGRRGAVVARLA